MGCDIHLVAETRDREGNWHFVSGPIIDCWSCEGDGFVTVQNHRHANPEWLSQNLGKPCRQCNPRKRYRYDPETEEEHEDVDPDQPGPGKLRDSWWSDRNYDTFAILANVRNGSGFAGTRTGDRFTSISSGRGWPDDLTAESLEWFEHHGGDHSETWVGLDEILAYDFDAIVAKTGVVNVEQFRTFLTNGSPESWSGDVQGGRVRYLDHATIQTFFTSTPDHPGSPYYDGVYYVTRVNWTQTVRTSTEKFLDRMKELAVTVGEQPCRLIMNFDS